jgi:type IV pilus biogenesis protein CpaD/CtpE
MEYSSAALACGGGSRDKDALTAEHGVPMRVALTMAVGLVLAGCASRQETALLDDQKCRTDGLRPGTDEYDRCRTAFDAARQQENVVQAMRQQQESMQRNMQSISRMPTR